MPLHTIKKISELVPEVGALVKRASLEQNLPTGSKEETLVSALELEYMIKFAHTNVDVSDAERVCKAVDLYGIADEVRKQTGSMIKAASYNKREGRGLSSAVSHIDESLNSLYPPIEKIAEASEKLWDEYSDQISSDSVKRYACAGTLVKEAALNSLAYRAKRTGNVEFEKIAEVISSTNTDKLSVEDNRAIVSAIRGLEKSAQYYETDIYKEIFMTKEAACNLSLNGKIIQAEDLVAIADKVGSYLGADIGELLANAHSNVDAIEALPLGEKQVIIGMIGA